MATIELSPTSGVAARRESLAGYSRPLKGGAKFRTTLRVERTQHETKIFRGRIDYRRRSCLQRVALRGSAGCDLGESLSACVDSRRRRSPAGL